MSDRFSVLLQHALPKQGLTVLAGRIARARAGTITTRLIRWFVARYGVDMSEAADPDIASYASFNDFFTRPLKAGARPLAPGRCGSANAWAIARSDRAMEISVLCTTIDALGNDRAP